MYCKPSTAYALIPLSPGQQRSRMLATLFKDERCQQLAAYGILEKMYLDRIIRGNQLQEFAAMLMPHQKATTADGQSPLHLKRGKFGQIHRWYRLTFHVGTIVS